MHVLENFKHADTFSQMPMGDKLLATGYVILLGMGITFIALVLIWLITVLMSRIIREMEKSQEIKKVPNVPKPTVAPNTEKPIALVETEDDEELIAVISAAIAATLNTSMNSIRVTNIRRVPDNTPTWGKVGRNDVMNARF